MFVTLTVVAAILLVPGIERLRRMPRSRPIDEERFHAAVHSELQAGASLRSAISAAAQDLPELAGIHRAAVSGHPMDEVAAALLVLPNTGSEARVAVRVADLSGGRAADVFLRMADRAAAAADLDRQRRILTAQARLSAAIVGGLPFVWLLFGGVGRLRALVDNGGGAIGVAGIVMEAVGVALVWKLAVT
ncbi:MAG: hypothetical protein GY722_24210 [bacterium]|nr:hypothetical protein [bacterium]